MNDFKNSFSFENIRNGSMRCITKIIRRFLKNGLWCDDLYYGDTIEYYNKYYNNIIMNLIMNILMYSNVYSNVYPNVYPNSFRQGDLEHLNSKFTFKLQIYPKS